MTSGTTSSPKLRICGHSRFLFPSRYRPPMTSCKKRIVRELRDRGRISQSYLCFKPRQIFDNLEDQHKIGRKAWVEDAGGKVLD